MVASLQLHYGGGKLSDLELQELRGITWYIIELRGAFVDGY